MTALTTLQKLAADVGVTYNLITLEGLMAMPSKIKTQACKERRHKKCPYRPTFYGGKYTNCECFCHNEKDPKKVTKPRGIPKVHEAGKKIVEALKKAGFHPMKRARW